MSNGAPAAAELAINGGAPVRDRPLPYGHHCIEDEDVQAVVEVLRSDWLTTGPNVREFEEAFAAAVGARYAVSFSSGTAALQGAVFAADVRAGDEGVTSPLTFCASANCLLYQGATPVFADVCDDTLTLDPDAVARRITLRTKVLLPVDYAGHPAEMDAIMTAADRHGLVVIEDASHALGATYRGRRVGSIAHMSVFSFHPVKHITTGEGGMVTTDRPEYAQRLRRFRSHGIEYAPDRRRREPWYYEMVCLGYNYRLTDIGSVLGRSQLRRLDANLAARRKLAKAYDVALGTLPAIRLPEVRGDVEPAWHIYPVRLWLERLTADRATIFRALRAENIGVQVHYIPVYLHPYYRRRFGSLQGHCPVAEEAYSRLISFPLFHGMTDRDLEDVVQALAKVVRAYSQ